MEEARGRSGKGEVLDRVLLVLIAAEPLVRGGRLTL